MNASLAKLSECYLCLLHCYFVVVVDDDDDVDDVWLAFWRGRFGNGTYTKLITHPLLIITCKKELELRAQ